MSENIIKIHNATTGEIIERPMTEEELEQWQADQAAAQLAKDEEESKATAKAALLDRLGITADEAKLLLG
jgi:hypothetical protein